VHVGATRRNSSESFPASFEDGASASAPVMPRGERIPDEGGKENTTTLKPPDFLVKTALKGESRWH